MSKYTPLIQRLESPDETRSFNSVARDMGFDPNAAYGTMKNLRPDLLGPRSKRLGFSKIERADIPDNVRAEALSQALSGTPVKEVAQATGVPAPTIYSMLQRARKRAAPPTGLDSASAEFLLSVIRAAATKAGVTPEELCDTLRMSLTKV